MYRQHLLGSRAWETAGCLLPAAAAPGLVMIQPLSRNMKRMLRLLLGVSISIDRLGSIDPRCISRSPPSLPRCDAGDGSPEQVRRGPEGKGAGYLGLAPVRGAVQRLRAAVNPARSAPSR
ncbi:hypothetical protein NDU88_005237 [Pleurodeles waltl]|uniref:Uncharacterized protein n=1 Tax=Pleurodeles waltl TaxID=8319 RepID=A0AAV7L2J0_PLEWA|nr:hypothetical protein NDU88_005237 [Pleurodeles waltl]